MSKKYPKSKRAIIETFLKIRKKKELEKITVTELCKLADINKSTFYVYFHDILDLSEQLETQLVQSILNEISHPEDVLNKPEQFTKNLFEAYTQKEEEIHILFSGSRQLLLPNKFAKEIKRFLFEFQPHLKEDPIANIQLSFAIYGSFYSYLDNLDCEKNLLVSTISTLVKKEIK